MVFVAMGGFLLPSSNSPRYRPNRNLQKDRYGNRGRAAFRWRPFFRFIDAATVTLFVAVRSAEFHYVNGKPTTYPLVLQI